MKETETSRRSAHFVAGCPLGQGFRSRDMGLEGKDHFSRAEAGRRWDSPVAWAVPFSKAAGGSGGQDWTTRPDPEPTFRRALVVSLGETVRFALFPDARASAGNSFFELCVVRESFSHRAGR